MIRFLDAAALAYTKLRTHLIRTGIAVGVSGILFGLIAAVIMVAQGVFDSVDRFSGEGLNNRTIVAVSKFSQASVFDEYQNASDQAFIAEIESAQKDLVAKKTAAAKKYSVSYDAALEDPSPIIIDPTTKQKIVSEAGLSSGVVTKVAAARRAAEKVPFDINAYIKPYSTASVIGKNNPLTLTEGTLDYMKDNKEALVVPGGEKARLNSMEQQPPSLTVLESSVTEPFITNTAFDPLKGEIPGVFPYGLAEKTLGYKPLPAGASVDEKLERLQQVRNRINEVSVSYCYRNPASLALANQAVAQRADIERNVSNKEYKKPSLIYTVPNPSTCGAVTTSSDIRTAAEKKQDANQVLYEKEVGIYIGDPAQQKVTIRGVGVANDLSSTASESSVSSMVQGLLGSWLGYGTIAVPEGLLAQVPEQSRPKAIFEPNSDTVMSAGPFYLPESYLVEFGDKAQARLMMEKAGSLSLTGGTVTGDTYITPFGSGVLIVDELRRLFEQVLLWVFLIVGSVAVIILGSMIGRTVSEGRRESAVFRAIGAKRSDIAAIYGTYALLLSLRAVLFAGVLALVIAFTVEFLFWYDATLGARLAYAASDSSVEFHLFSLNSIYLLYIVGVILISGLVASIIPILLGARRSPIKDMRDDT